MPIRIDNPREIGADRLVNAVAAYEKVGGACVVVDFGTALTYDVVSEDGEYLGGIISPGVEISLEALTERAAALPKIDLTAPRAVIGKSTVDAIRSGVVYGFAAQVDGIVGRLRDELGAARDASPPAGWPAPIVALLRADRRGRRPAHADGPAAHLGAEPLTQRGQLAPSSRERASALGLEPRRRRPRGVAEHAHARPPARPRTPAAASSTTTQSRRGERPSARGVQEQVGRRLAVRDVRRR